MMRLSKIRGLFDFCKNMGGRYVSFRAGYEIKIRMGLLKLLFPVQVAERSFATLDDWRNLRVRFFFKPGNIQVDKDKSLSELQLRASHISRNRFQFFSHHWYEVNDWHTNPETGFTYDIHKHWTNIPDFSKAAGDIKFVWEKSRFTFLYDLIRYDFHFEEDQSTLAFRLIVDWIDKNPVNCGPNWRCGQEITFRVFNWIFALHYYQHSERLSQECFDKISGSIHQQMLHVEQNIRFSLIAVRNNHALTESLGLYLVGLLLPFFPESERWRMRGKKLFEKEIAYQIAADGTFLQFSMNYHRVVVQLLTWAIGLAELNGENWSEEVYDRAEKTFRFLRTCQDIKTGHLPNYGNNDGALFFPLTSCEYRDFRPQLAALAALLNIDPDYEPGNWNEEAAWLAHSDQKITGKSIIHDLPTASAFSDGGYYVLRDCDTISFLRCGKYRDRPFQADNLHLDIWVTGENILRDAGSYLYNTDEKWSGYFSGTASHNTIMLGDFDQMRRVSGFMWSDWIRKAECEIAEEADQFLIDAEFEGFAQVGKSISHRRKVVKFKGRLTWIVEDWLTNVPAGTPMKQIWHPSDYFFEHYHIQSWDENAAEIIACETTGWFSEYYGSKVQSRRIVFSTFGSYVRTMICARLPT